MRTFGAGVVAVIWCAAASVALAIQQQRDTSAPISSGTGTVTGRVMSADLPAVPVPRARVTLTGSTSDNVRSVTAGDDGRFQFTGLPADRYVIAATKAAYLRAEYGAVRPNGAGVPLVLGEGQTSDVALTMVRGGVITGTVRDVRGRPVQNVLAYAGRPGRRHFAWMIGEESRLSVAATDDRGVYRIYGLPPGEYFVWIDGPGPVSGQTALRITAAEDVRYARRAIALDRQPGSDVGLASPPARQNSEYARMYFPDGALATEAKPVRVGQSEVREGVDLVRRLVPTVRLAGRVVDPAGRAFTRLTVWIRPAVLRDGASPPHIAANVSDGSFESPAVPPGDYVISAMAALAQAGETPAATPGRPSFAPLTHWARLRITAGGADQPDLNLSLQPAVAITGRVVFEADETQTPNPTTASITIFETNEVMFPVVPTARIAADGTFKIESVMPAQYRFSVPPPAGWVLKSILGGRVDYTDVPLDVPAAAGVSDLVVTFARRASQLSGRLQDASGRPAIAYTVVAFSADPTYWTLQSRRILAVRPAENGQYLMNDLPPGDYLVAALTDIDDDQWFRPEFLETLRPFAVRVTVPADGRAVQDLQIRR